MLPPFKEFMLLPKEMQATFSETKNQFPFTPSEH